MKAFLVPIQLGRYQLPNRLVMSTQSLMRAIDYCPQSIMETYYAQRSTAGLIISEPTLIAQPCPPLPCCPGLFTQAHVEAWRPITRAIHKSDGKIFVQLWHGANLDYLYESNRGSNQRSDVSFPQQRGDLAAQPEDRATVLQQFREAAQYAITADFDGIEIHGALRNLTQQFSPPPLSPDYLRAEGIEQMDTPLLLELVDVLSAIWDSDRIGVFLSASSAFSDYYDPDPEATLYIIADALSYSRLAYVHLQEPRPEQSILGDLGDSLFNLFRPIFQGPIIVDTQEDLPAALKLLQAGTADLASFRQYFAANPDLVTRLALDLSLNPLNETAPYRDEATDKLD